MKMKWSLEIKSSFQIASMRYPIHEGFEKEIV